MLRVESSRSTRCALRGRDRAPYSGPTNPLYGVGVPSRASQRLKRHSALHRNCTLGAVRALDAARHPGGIQAHAIVGSSHGQNPTSPGQVDVGLPWRCVMSRVGVTATALLERSAIGSCGGKTKAG